MTCPCASLIADDERPARRFLANLLAGCADVELVGEATNGKEAVALIEALRPIWRCSTCRCRSWADSTSRGW